MWVWTWNRARASSQISIYDRMVHCLAHVCTYTNNSDTTSVWRALSRQVSNLQNAIARQRDSLESQEHTLASTQVYVCMSFVRLYIYTFSCTPKQHTYEGMHIRTPTHIQAYLPFFCRMRSLLPLSLLLFVSRSLTSPSSSSSGITASQLSCT
jgi:hypothetical protein